MGDFSAGSFGGFPRHTVAVFADCFGNINLLRVAHTGIPPIDTMKKNSKKSPPLLMRHSDRSILYHLDAMMDRVIISIL